MSGNPHTAIPQALRQFPELFQMGSKANAMTEPSASLERSELRSAKKIFKEQVAIFLARSRSVKVDGQKFYESALSLGQSPEHLNYYTFLCVAAFIGEEKQPYLALAAAFWSFADFLAGTGASPLLSVSLRPDTILSKLPPWLAIELAKKNAPTSELNAWNECAHAAQRLVEVAHARLGKLAQDSAAEVRALSPDETFDDEALSALIGVIENSRPPAITETAAADAVTTSESRDEAAATVTEQLEAAAAPVVQPPASTPALPGTLEQHSPFSIALQRISSEPHDPLPYLLLRSALWLGVRELPATLPAPPQALRERFQSAFSAESSPAVEMLRDGEQLLGTYPLWLDLQLCTVIALESLHAASARDAVGHCVSMLMQRFPELLHRRLSDGTPVASELTKQWIEREQRRWQLESAPPLIRASGGQSLRVLLRRLQEQVLAARSGRDRFALRLDGAQLCLDKGRADLSAGLLTRLLSDTEHYRLEEWEPALLCRVLQVHGRVAASPVARIEPEQRQRVRQLLCQLDLVAAEQLESP